MITAPNSDLNVTDGQTDRQTNITVAVGGITALYVKHHTVKAIAHALRSKSAWALSYLAVKLFSKNSNLCDHDT